MTGPVPRVLSIDDEPAILANIAAYLEDSGYTVLTAANGRIGLQMFRSEKPDIVLVDLRMPEVDGLEVLSRVTTEDPDTPIVVVSGTGVIKDAIEAIRLGAWDFLTKPIQDMAVLEHAVRKALERAQLRRENERYRRHLEEEIQRRTADLARTTDELRVANEKLRAEMAERLRMENEILKIRKFESIGLLAGGIAHDFNNILAAILGNVSLAKMFSVSDDRLYRRLSEAEKATVRARDLTQQLLLISKGGAPLRKRLSPIGDLIRDTATFILSGTNAQCVVHIPPEIWSLEIDEGQISQVVSNLVINAKQAMPDGGTVEVSAENVELGLGQVVGLAPGKYVKVSVTDHGVGISEEIADKIFDPYFTTKPTGSGLGLAGSYAIIQKHDGIIRFESQPGVFTTFHFYLPASPDRKAAPERVTENIRKGSGRVLVMEDDEGLRTLCSDMLGFLGYEADFAKSEAESVAMFARARGDGRPYDAVLLDLTVRGGGGARETLPKLVEIDPNVKAIVTSGYPNDPIVVECRKHGFRGSISKPFRTEDLHEVLRSVIEGS